MEASTATLQSSQPAPASIAERSTEDAGGRFALVRGGHYETFVDTHDTMCGAPLPVLFLIGQGDARSPVVQVLQRSSYLVGQSGYGRIRCVPTRRRMLGQAGCLLQAVLGFSCAPPSLESLAT
jgi:hypothetical protein